MKLQKKFRYLFSHEIFFTKLIYKNSYFEVSCEKLVADKSFQLSSYFLVNT